MLIRRLSTVVMTALVLLCPFFSCGECGGISPAAAADSVEGEAAGALFCSCCRGEHTAPVKPELPDDERDVDCFCAGTVLPAVAECPEPGDSTGDLPLTVVDSAYALSPQALLSHSSRLPRNRCHFPPMSSGREIRALIDSHLL